MQEVDDIQLDLLVLFPLLSADGMVQSCWEDKKQAGRTHRLMNLPQRVIRPRIRLRGRRDSARF